MNLKRFKMALREYAPEILTGIGITGFIGSMILLNRAAPVARDLIEERKLDEHKDKLTIKETVETTWKVYAPVVITATGATACIVSGAAKNHKKNAALAAAYGISQETLSIYRKKVVEAIGEKKEAEIREETDREMVRKHPPMGFGVNIEPPDSLFEYDGDYFCSTWNNVKEAVNQLGEDMLDNPHNPEVMDNDFRELVGLRYTEKGYRYGWHRELTGRPQLYPPSCIELPSGQICYVLTFREGPIDLYPTRKLRRV